jgi:hypothetical protein
MGYKSGFSRLNEEEKQKIIFLSEKETLPAVYDSTKFYAITALHLKAYMSQFDTCLIYLWSPNCSADLCLSPLVYIKYCRKNNYQLILIPESYYYLRDVEDFRSAMGTPILCINSFHYKNDILNQYVKAFKKDLFDNQYKELHKELSSRLWLYKDNTFYNANDVLHIEELTAPRFDVSK